MAIGLFFLVGVLLMQFVSPSITALQYHNSIFVTLVQTITHMFSHANWSHLLGNFIFVFPYALYVEYRVGFKRFCQVWLVCGLVAALSQLLLNSALGEYVGLIGSSGAAFGIVAAALILVDESLIFKLVARCVLAYLMLQQINYIMTILENPILRIFFNVAFMAHIGGMCAGIWLALHDKYQRYGKKASIWKYL